MSSPAESEKHNPLSHLINSISSYDSNIMLAAVISLLVVILFVLLLHVYAKWFLAQTRQRRSSSSVSVSHVLGPSRFNHFQDSLTFNTVPPSKTIGLDSSTISSIPFFVYKLEDCEKGSLECVICLSHFEENEVGRRITTCGHGFHIECIDMWLNSHTNCPICRAPAVGEAANDGETPVEASTETGEEVSGDPILENVIINVPLHDNETGNSGVNHESLSETTSSSSSSSSSSLACSLKRMLSRNRSECKIFPSANANVTESNA